MSDRRKQPPNKWGCKPDGDVCLEHDEPLVCKVGCSLSGPHKHDGKECYARGAHGPQLVCYAGGPGEPYYQPTIQCICGWYSQRQETWEEAGQLFDEHLEEVNNYGKTRTLYI